MKKEILTISVLIISLSLIGSVSASVYNIEINQVGDKLLAKHIISLDSENTIQINIPSDASSLSSKQDYSIENNVATITGKNIELSYLTQGALQKSDDGYYFVEDIKFNSNFDEATIKLILDTGYFLDNEHIYPKPTKIETDGRQISVIWELKDTKQGSDIPIFLTIFSSSASSSILIWAIILVLLIVVGYFLYKFYPKKGKKEGDIEKHLMESEKSILNEIKKADRGEIWQKQLQLKTNFSKAKLSRVIRNLESRNLVEKIPFGNTNKVRLK